MDIASLRPMAGDQPNRFLLESIGLNSQILNIQRQEFPQALGEEGESKVFCFYEMLESPTTQQVTINALHATSLNIRRLITKQDKQGRWTMTGPPALLVTKASATHCRPWENRPEHIYPISRSHSEMVKFGKHNDEYEKVVQRLIGLARRAIERGVRNREAKKPPSKNLPMPTPAVQEEGGDKILETLSYPGMQTSMRSRNLGTSRSSGTCEWLLEHSLYQNWLKTPKGLLWVRGKPGSGKSTLIEFAFQKLKSTAGNKPDHPLLATFYFSSTADKTLEQSSLLSMLRSLLYQICLNSPSLYSKFRAYFESQLGGETLQQFKWQAQDLLSFFHEVANASETPEIRIFIDTVDESGESEALSALFDKLTSSVAPISVCASSRHYRSPHFSRSPGLDIIMDESNGEDISKYVNTMLNGYHLPEDLTSWIIRASSGIFLWAKLVIPLIQREYKRTIDKKEISRIVQETLIKNLKGLDAVFSRILNGISDEERQKSCHLMQLVCFSERPLTSKELFAALTFDASKSGALLPQHGQKSWGPEELAEFLSTVQSFSGGIVEFYVNEEDEYMADFIHLTAREFLVREGLAILEVCKPSTSIGQENFRLAKMCVQYISLETLRIAASYMSIDELLLEFWMLKYAVQYVFVHLAIADANGDLNDEDAAYLLNLLQKGKKGCFSLWLRMHKLLFQGWSKCLEEEAMLLHAFSAYNIPGCGRLLLEHASPDYINSQDANKMSALHWAATWGHHAMVKLLLGNEPPADVDAQDENGRTALHMACYAGQKDTVKELLLAGANCESTDVSGWRPFHQAVDGGSEDVVALLLEQGANVNAQDKSGRNALMRAAKWNHPGILEMLIKHGAEVNTVAEDGSTALHDCAFSNNVTSADRLLDKGADIEAKLTDGSLKTPLLLAVEKGRVEATRFLLGKGADARAKGRYGVTALHYAAAMGGKGFGLASPLLDNKADVMARARLGGTPLHAAAHSGHVPTVELLLRFGADPGAKMEMGETPLDEAANDEVGSLLKAAAQAGEAAT